MTTRVAPWLEGLSEAWEAPQKATAPNQLSSATHDAGALQSIKSRIPRPSLSSHPSASSRNTISRNNTQKSRNPLSPISANEENSLKRYSIANKVPGARSVSAASNGSLLGCGTVAKRSKSSSPSKRQQTLEWKRRLVNGQVGYGDQTDLFGPSGLENIFARSKGAENEAPKPKNRMGWLQKSDAPMPSSPPPLPSCFVEESEFYAPEALDDVVEEQGDSQEFAEDGSFRSNPFDLESSAHQHQSPQQDSRSSVVARSSPDKAFIEPSQDELAQNRTISGQTELEQEDFSPVFVSKHKTVSGQVNYAALDSHVVKQFQNQQIDLRHPSQRHSDGATFDSGLDQNEHAEHDSSADHGRNETPPVAPDLSFSENLPTGSPVPNLGTNVQLKRGGYSQHGSFKHRPLSPSPAYVEDSLNPEASALLSPMPSGQHCPPAPSPPGAPLTPTRSEPDESKQRSSGSPLKLFGAHDTYTSNQLLRRMSQLNPDGTLRHKPNHGMQDDDSSRSVSDASSFGNGELDDHIFNADITITSASDSDKDDSDRSPGSEIPAPGSKDPLAFRFADTVEIHDTFKMKRKMSKASAAASRGSTVGSQKKAAAGMREDEKGLLSCRLRNNKAAETSRQLGEGKRPPTSPFKNPTPKRRRTLHASELDNGIATMNESYHSQLQEAVSSRKRKDALPGESQNRADPEILSQRKILRPRNPTPSQRRREQIEAELREAAEEFAEQEPKRLEAVMEQLESSIASEEHTTLEQQAQTLASEIAAFTLRVEKPSGEQSERKRSVTTQDFLNEAMMVMNLIRAKARPQSNLGSVEESDADALKESPRASNETPEDSLLRVSRPPSREGSGWRLRAPVQTDARVISHLRKFEEKEEIDDTNFIANSIASLQVDEEQMNDQVVVVDEQANVRITGPPPRAQHKKTDSGSDPHSHQSHGSTANTQNSNGESTGRTIATSSTRKSDNVGTLAPDAVAHLIGEQVGGMTFDKDKQRWVRVSKSPEKQYGSFLELPSNVTSDDDPFREISDLPVDEQKERRHLSAGDNKADMPPAEGKPAIDDEALGRASQPTVESRTSSQDTVLPRPVTRDSSHVQPHHSSSVPSKYTAFASSQQYEKVETRATSWSDEELAKMSVLGKERRRPILYAAAEAAMQQLTGADGSVRVFNHGEKQSNPPLATVLENQKQDPTDIEPQRSQQTPYRPQLPPRPAFNPLNRQISLRKQTLTHMLDQDSQEESEISIVAPLPGERVMSLSLSVSRPKSRPLASRRLAELQSSPSKGSPGHILSDLPDFTIHEDDEERPSERALASRLAQHTADEVNDRYALAVKDLVKILTDVNEDEPYWEDLKHVDLHDRSVNSLHGLKDFCAYIQDMDVSNNALQHLTGAPCTIRRLNASFNQLSSLTSWHHLANLQYLNISNNKLENLDALACLVHLRELRADDNQISIINGIFVLDGLLKLRLRRNMLGYVNFQDCRLQRLAELDLCQNQIETLSSLDKLSSLVDLKLDGNQLTQGLPAEAMSELRSLSMRNCNAESLDVSRCPKLAQLNVDENRICKIESISALRYLSVLSMRRQDLPDMTPLSVFDQPIEASAVYLSGNKLPSIHLAHSFLNLRRLELASVGLQELPADFGLRMPNLRTLNLNFNSLKDIRPLLNIQRLAELSVCGNRLQRLRKSIATFGKLKHLRMLDLRDNHLTQGFYPSLASTMSKNTAVALRTLSQVTLDEDEQLAQAEKSRYELPQNNAGSDKQHRARFDEDAKLRRRVYEVLLGNSCSELVQLDGLDFDRSKALRRDAVWDRLVELCIIKKSQDGSVEVLE